MNKQILNQDSNEMSPTQVEFILAEWMSEMARFHAYYRSLTTYVKCNHIDLSVKQSSIYVGQCSVDQLKSLMCTMQRELQQLVEQVGDIDAVGQKPDKTDYKTITGHTTILKRLNEEAKIKLCLVSLPAS